MPWGWFWFPGRRGWVGPWPGRGPFSHLPPWLRPGWLFGRGICRWLFWWYWWHVWRSLHHFYRLYYVPPYPPYPPYP